MRSIRWTAVILTAWCTAPLFALAQEGDKLPEYALARIGDNRYHGGGHRIKFAPDGKVIAVAERESIRLVDLDGRPRMVLRHFRPPNVIKGAPIPTDVVDMVFSADGKTLVSAGEEGGVHVWNVADGKETRFSAIHPGIATLVLTVDGLVTAGFDGVLRQWEFPQMTPLKTWEAPGNEPILALAQSGAEVSAVSKGGVLYRWNPATGKETRRVELGGVLLGSGPEFAARLFPAKGSVYPSFAVHPRNVEFSADGKWLVQHLGQQVWNVQTGKVVAQLPVPKDAVRLAFSWDGKQVAVAPTGYKERLRLFDSVSGEERRQIDVERVAAIAFSPDGQTIAFTRDHALHLWKHAANERIGGSTLGDIRDWDLSPDGTQIAVGTREKTLGLFDAWTGKHRETFATDGVADLVRFHPDGRALVVGISSQGLIHYQKEAGGWKAARKFAVKEPFAEIHGPTPLAPIGSKTIRMASLFTGETQPGLRPQNKYSHFSVSSDGRRLLVAAEVPATKAAGMTRPAQREYHLHSLPTLKFIQSFKQSKGTPAFAKFSPDGRLAILHGKPLQVVELASGAQRATLLLPERVTTVDFAPDGNSLLAGTAQGDLVVLGLAKGEELLRIAKAHGASVREIRTTRLGTVISVGYDQTLLVWSEQVWKNRAVKPMLKLDSEDLDLFHQFLGDKDGPNIAQAIASLISGGDATVRYLKGKLKPATDAQKTVPGTHRTVGELRAGRALEILERIGTPAARELLESLARGDAEAPFTIDAKESLSRLAR